MRCLLVGTLAALGACVSIETHAPPDAALHAIQHAQLRACPADRVQNGAFSSGETATEGVTAEDLGLTPLASDPTRALRLRRLVMAPGATIAWHTHEGVQGMALIVSGEVIERRNSCLDEMTYRAGDIAPEDVNTAHSWRNESDAEAVILVAHVAPRP